MLNSPTRPEKRRVYKQCVLGLEQPVRSMHVAEHMQHWLHPMHRLQQNGIARVET